MSSNIFFSADLHINHAKILEFCSDTRRGGTVSEHNENIVESWNSIVKEGDVCYILGDEVLGNRDEGYEILSRLNGDKHLIKGNHTLLKHQWQKDIFHSISDIKKISVNLPEGGKQQIIMCHYPIMSWENMGHGSWHLHGHSHGSLKDLGGKMMDVGIDTRPSKDMKPWSLNEIEKFMSGREVMTWDHHW